MFITQYQMVPLGAYGDQYGAEEATRLDQFVCSTIFCRSHGFAQYHPSCYFFDNYASYGDKIRDVHD